MGVLGDINSSLFGGNKTTTKSTLNAQQQGVMDEMMNASGTYRDMANQSKSLYNPNWEQKQDQQVMMPLQQRMADNVRSLQNTSRKSGRATSSIGRRLNESSNLRMSQMKMQQSVIENQKRISMEQEARQRALGYENMANQQLSGVVGRRAKENIVQQEGGLLSPILKVGQMATSGKNLYDSMNFKSGKEADTGSGGNMASSMANSMADSMGTF